MRAFLTVLVLLTGGVSQAATVTIDFEGAALGTFADYGEPIGTYSDIVVDGYRFTEFPNYANPRIVVDTGGNQSMTVGGGYCGPYGQCESVYIFMSRVDGGAFSFLSADISESCWTTSGTCDTGVLATKFGGGSVSGSIGSGDWLNLESVTFYAAGDTDSPDGVHLYSISVDNIVVQAVPIPATLWLFGSALAGLGWLKRKQTV